MKNSNYQILAMSRKMLTRYIFITVMLLIVNLSFGQAPGFMGKKLIIGAEASMIVVLNGVSLLGGGPTDFQYIRMDESGEPYIEYVELNGLSFNIKPTFYVEYVLNRKSSLQLMTRMFNSLQDVTGYYEQEGSSSYYYYPTDKVKSKTFSLGIRYKKFKGSSINPVGKYFSVGLEYATMKFLMDDVSFFTSDLSNQGQPTNIKSSTLIPTFGLGTAHPLGSSLLLNFGIEFGYPINNLINSKNNEVRSDNWAVINSLGTFKNHYFINITIGLAFLPKL